MRILYIANHNCGGNDDEGAISHALRELGHDVSDVHENHHWPIRRHASRSYDLLLFHKWAEVDLLRLFSCPKVFWYFDLVDSCDPTLSRRDEARKAWMKRMIPEVTLGFCTDGDWVSRYNGEAGGKLVWLTQGADGRIVGRGERKRRISPILFTGIGRGGGTGREEWLRDMKSTWGDDFVHVRSGLHQEALRDAIASSTFYACPNSPGSNSYWSNRVYNAAGFGATILHPVASGLFAHYNANEVMYYSSLRHFNDLVRGFSDKPKLRDELSDNALERTKKNHLYVHRVAQLLATVKERTNVQADPRSSVLEGPT